MKLYSTIKNEKLKTASIAGNESITIELNKGNRRMIELYATIEEVEGVEFLAVDMLNLSDASTQRVFTYEFYKGKK